MPDFKEFSKDKWGKILDWTHSRYILENIDKNFMIVSDGETAKSYKVFIHEHFENSKMVEVDFYYEVKSKIIKALIWSRV